MTDNGTVRPSVDHERRIYVARDGTELHLQPISALVLERLYNDMSGKPEIPMIEVVIAGKHKHKEPNPDDEDYKKALEAWTERRGIKICKFVLIRGIADDTPAAFVRDNREFFPDASVSEMKYIWLVGLLGPMGEDIQPIVEAIVGQTSPTEKGLEIATQSFQGDGGRLRPASVLSEPTSSQDQLLPELRGGASENGHGSDD